MEQQATNHKHKETGPTDFHSALEKRISWIKEWNHVLLGRLCRFGYPRGTLLKKVIDTNNELCRL